MSTRNLTDMLARVSEMSSLTSADAARVTDFVNEALVDFARDAAVAPVLVNIATVIGQRSYSLASVGATGVLRVLADDPDDSATSLRTTTFSLRGLTTVVLDAVPGAVTQLPFWVVPRPAELTTGSDVFPFDREWYRGVLYRAAQLAMEWDRQDEADVQVLKAKYEEEVAKARRQKAHAGPNQALRPSARGAWASAAAPFRFLLP